jgi:benzoylformate decarboxylase
VKHLVQAFLDRQLSRRDFANALAALGLAAASIESVVQAAAEAQKVGAAVSLKRTGGEVLVQQMIAAGVKFVFSNPGSYEVGFFEALYSERDKAHLIMGLHEGLVVAMADGYHKVSREPAFVNLHVIAGTAQAAGQMYNASRDGSAIVVTAGLLDNEVYSDNIVLGPRPGFNQKEINRQFTKLSWESHDARGVAAMLRRAFTLATAPPSGPVYVAFPNTVLEQRDVQADILPRERFMPKRLGDVLPDPKQVDELAKMLLDAKKPALILGDEVYKANALEEALELAELLSLPVHESPLPAFHCFPRQHPLFQGKFTSHERVGKKPKGTGFDFVLNAGDYDLGDYDVRELIRTVPEYPLFEPGTKVARFGLNPNSIGRNTGFDLAFLANVKLTLAALIEAVKKRGVPKENGPWKGRRRPPVELEKERRGMNPIHPDELGWALERVLNEVDEQAIIVSENLSGSNHFLSTGGTDAKTWIGNSSAGLGWGIGAATGAKLAAPKRQVVCNIGDGSVMYGAAGFWTQARYRIPVLTVVCNNRNYQTVRHAYSRARGKMWEKEEFPGMYLGDPEIDFVKLAQSQGVDGIRVEDSGKLEGALRKGAKETENGNPFLVEVVVRTVRNFEELKGREQDESEVPYWHGSFQLAKK